MARKIISEWVHLNSNVKKCKEGLFPISVDLVMKGYSPMLMFSYEVDENAEVSLKVVSFRVYMKEDEIDDGAEFYKSFVFKNKVYYLYQLK